MYFTLSTNAFTLKDRKDENGKTLQNKECEISIVVLESDLEKGIENPIFYASRYGMIYNPNEDFKPNIPPNHKIKGQLVDDYWEQLPAARKKYVEMLAKYSKAGETKTGETEHLQGEIEVLKNELHTAKQIIESKNADLRTTREKMTSNNNSDEMNEMKKALAEATQLIKAQQKELQEAKLKSDVIRHEKFQTIVTLIEEGEAVYLHGPAGTGKSKIAEQVAEYLKLDFHPASTITQEFKLTGFIDGNGIFHDTNFYKAVKYGGVFFLDEMDSCISDVLVGINGCLASGYFDFPNETVKAHKDFRVIAAGNTIGRGADENYTGRNALDLSTLDRFWAVEILYSPAIDLAVAKNDTELVDFANAVRSASEKSGIMILMSYRSISRIAKFKDKFTLVEIMAMAVIKGVASDDVNMLARNMDIDRSNKYFKAFKDAA